MDVTQELEQVLVLVLVTNDDVSLLRIVRKSYVLVRRRLERELEQVWVANDGVD